MRTPHGVAARLTPFGTTVFTRMTRLAVAHKAVNLAQGFPDFDGPEFLKAEANAAMLRGENQYARMFGVPPLCTALADRWRADTGLDADPDTCITVTSGCTEAIAATLLGLVNPGDEVVLFEPFYDSYRACVAMAGATARFVTLRATVEGGLRTFGFDPGSLRAAVTDRTRAILVNTPHNPTGKVFSRVELEQIAAVCRERDCLAFTDEVYERLTFDATRPHIRLATLPGMADRTVTLSSLGKSFSMTGWKIGWAIAPPTLSAGIRAAHQFLTFATATPLQHAAAVAVAPGGPGDACASQLREELRSARDFMEAALSRLGFEVFRTDGTYFIMAGWRTSAPARALTARGVAADSDEAFCAALCEHAGVAAIPPSVFYDDPAHAGGRELVRFAFCKRRATLDEAVRRLDSFCRV